MAAGDTIHSQCETQPMPSSNCTESKISEDDNNNSLKWQRGRYSTHTAEQPPRLTVIFVNIQLWLMTMWGFFCEWLRINGWIANPVARDDPRHVGFGSLETSFESMFINQIYRVYSDTVNRPICGVPANVMRIKERYTLDNGWTYKFTGTERDVINLGSYNYLGFSHNDGPCAENASEFVDTYGLHIGATRHEQGNHQLQSEVERCVAKYLGVEDAVCFPMGFATNSMNIPSIVDKGSLILSDRLNHSSIVLGCRMSGATIKVVEHNDPVDLERKIRRYLCEKSPKTGKPYNKVLIVIEGIYSMEGSIVNLPEYIRIKKKYGAYLYLDEAHSIGALGPTGRGVVEYWGCNPRDVDCMMGTLTKSFAAAGGYIGGSKALANHVRMLSAGTCYGLPMSPPIIAQILSSMKMMSGEDGSNIGKRKAVQLLRNARYMRRNLEQRGFLLYGHEDSPVIPMMTFYIPTAVNFSRHCLKDDIGVVAVGYPATDIATARIRFCMSADHTKEQIDYVVSIITKVGRRMGIDKYGPKKHVGQVIEY